MLGMISIVHALFLDSHVDSKTEQARRVDRTILTSMGKELDVPRREIMFDEPGATTTTV